MVAVKIECGCGQHYAFDVEPVNGRMTSTIACPTCGADGTTTANETIARSLPPPLAAPSPTLKITASEHPAHLVPPTVMVEARDLGLVDRTTAEGQARAKMSWGDAHEEVVKYLMLNGFSVPEAQALVKELYQERLATVRANGVTKILTGFGMMCLPIILLLVFAHFKVTIISVLSLSMAVGVWGFFRVWPFSRATGYRLVKDYMAAAGIKGAMASPKGLRHGFAVACLAQKIPLPTVQKWMGHARMETTAIYLDVSGEEERNLAERLWDSDQGRT